MLEKASFAMGLRERLPREVGDKKKKIDVLGVGVVQGKRNPGYSVWEASLLI